MVYPFNAGEYFRKKFRLRVLITINRVSGVVVTILGGLVILAAFEPFKSSYRGLKDVLLAFSGCNAGNLPTHSVVFRIRFSLHFLSIGVSIPRFLRSCQVYSHRGGSYPGCRGE